jgi:hypothetical protein
LLTFFYKSDFFIESFLQHMYGHHQEVLREAERCDQREKKVSPLVHQKNILKHKCFFLLIYFFKYIFSKLLTSHFLIIINWPALLMQKTGSNWIIWNHNICTLMMDYYFFFFAFSQHLSESAFQICFWVISELACFHFIFCLSCDNEKLKLNYFFSFCSILTNKMQFAQLHSWTTVEKKLKM